MFVSLIMCCFQYHASVIILMFWEHQVFYLKFISTFEYIWGEVHISHVSNHHGDYIFIVVPYISVSSVYDLLHSPFWCLDFFKWLLNFLENLCSLVLGYPSLFMNTGVCHIILWNTGNFFTTSIMLVAKEGFYSMEFIIYVVLFFTTRLLDRWFFIWITQQRIQIKQLHSAVQKFQDWFFLKIEDTCGRHVPFFYSK
jgi:hypothetical protein